MSNDVMFARLGHFLSPQLDIYRHLDRHVSGKSVLDIGCGTGFGSLQLTRSADTVVATETDPAIVSWAAKYIPRVEFIVDDLTQTQITRKFDAVLMIEVLEHIPLWRKALENARGLIADRGAFYISARNRNTTLRKNDQHEREWSAPEFKAALSEYFSVVCLYDYTLTNEQDDSTTWTPLLARCTK